MHYTTRVQIAQEAQIDKNHERIAHMAQATNAMKLKGEFHETASAMDRFLRDLINQSPRRAEVAKGPPAALVSCPV